MRIKSNLKQAARYQGALKSLAAKGLDHPARLRDAGDVHVASVDGVDVGVLVTKDMDSRIVGPDAGLMFVRVQESQYGKGDLWGALYVEVRDPVAEEIIVTMNAPAKKRKRFGLF